MTQMFYPMMPQQVCMPQPMCPTHPMCAPQPVQQPQVNAVKIDIINPQAGQPVSKPQPNNNFFYNMPPVQSMYNMPCHSCFAPGGVMMPQPMLQQPMVPAMMPQQMAPQMMSQTTSGSMVQQSMVNPMMSQTTSASMVQQPMVNPMMPQQMAPQVMPPIVKPIIQPVIIPQAIVAQASVMPLPPAPQPVVQPAIVAQPVVIQQAKTAPVKNEAPKAQTTTEAPKAEATKQEAPKPTATVTQTQTQSQTNTTTNTQTQTQTQTVSTTTAAAAAQPKENIPPVPPVPPVVKAPETEKIVNPTINMVEVNNALNSTDIDSHTVAIQKIAEALQTDPQNNAPSILTEQTFKGIVGIINKNTSTLPGPKPGAQADNNAPLSPLEKAEINKQFAIYTLAIMQKMFREEIDKEMVKNNLPTVSLTELPYIKEGIVDNLKDNPNPTVREACLSALNHVKAPQDKQVLRTLFEISAKHDASPSVKATAADFLQKLPA